jgi:hypothetical protein
MKKNNKPMALCGMGKPTTKEKAEARAIEARNFRLDVMRVAVSAVSTDRSYLNPAAVKDMFEMMISALRVPPQSPR